MVAKVSIGVPVYNVEEYLRRCLNSISEQTFTDFEVIMVDDGSTDNSFSICQEYVAKDSRFKLIHQENKGLAGARNTCIKNMHGEFITWIDSDDKVKPDYLEKLLQVQVETGAQIINCVYYYIRNEGDYYLDYTPVYPDLKRIELSGRNAIKMFLLDRYKTYTLWGTLVDSKLYKGWFCSQGVTFEDADNKFKLYLRTNKVVLVPEQLYGYRQRNSSIMKAATSQKTFSEELRLTKDLMHFIEKYIYYIEVANIDVEEEHLYIFEFIDVFFNSYRVGMIEKEEDKQQYFKYIGRYKEKLKRYWNMCGE
ncbi:glycosyltransferase family 2 protein [Ligilactobacillus salivarius]|uniref:Glycosyl transferase n=1 Tax=Ligilactobacillus salivarius TaxID=1624 RepID=A0A1Y0FA66_9LACO|nr:glycosyltransferase family 2 protein [Ligilactobacillus salivarius]ARU20196.1 glycosyl transferase [Ligilactobacillus salivarius]